MSSFEHQASVAIDQITDKNELRRVMMYAKHRYDAMVVDGLKDLSVGSRVCFVARGRMVYGVLTGYNRKTANVTDEVTRMPWRVSYGLLRAAPKPVGASPSI